MGTNEKEGREMEDFNDDFDNDDFMDEDSFEDEYDADTEMDDPFDGDSDLDGEPDEAESHDDEFVAKDEPCDDKLTAREVAILGGAMGFAYSEGLRERKRRKRKRFGDDLE